MNICTYKQIKNEGARMISEALKNNTGLVTLELSCDLCPKTNVI